MPANFLERKTWRNARQFSDSACTFHFDSHWKTWRSARHFSRTSFVFVEISFPGASWATLEDQVGSQVDLLMVLRTPFRKWTSPLCENPIIYYVFEVAFCENPGDVFWRPCGLLGHPWAHLFLTLASSNKNTKFQTPTRTLPKRHLVACGRPKWPQSSPNWELGHCLEDLFAGWREQWFWVPLLSDIQISKVAGYPQIMFFNVFL